MPQMLEDAQLSVDVTGADTDDEENIEFPERLRSCRGWWEMAEAARFRLADREGSHAMTQLRQPRTDAIAIRRRRLVDPLEEAVRLPVRGFIEDC